MNKEIRKSDWLDLQEEYQLEYESGYEAGMAGEPALESPSPSWRDGWLEAMESGPTCVFIADQE